QRGTAIAPAGSERMKVLIDLGRATSHSGDTRAAAALFAQALEEPCDDPRTAVSIEKELVWSNHMLGDLGTAEEHAEAAVALAEAVGDRAMLVETLGDLGLIQMLRRRTGYRVPLDRAIALELAERRDGAADEAPLGYWWMTDWQNAMALAWAGELDTARESLELLLRDAADRGDEQAVPYAITWLSRIAFCKDDWPTAARYAGEGYEASVSAPGERAFALVPRAVVAAHLGQVDAARAATDEGLRLAEQTGMVVARLDHLIARGALELSLADVEAARRFLAPLPGELRRYGFAEPAIFRFHPDLIETLVACGEIADARGQLAELEGIGDGCPRAVGGAAAA